MGNARVKEEHDTCSVGSFVEQIMALYPEDGDKLDVWDLPVFMGIWDEVAGCATEAGPIKAIQLGEFNQLVVCGYPRYEYSENEPIVDPKDVFWAANRRVWNTVWAFSAGFGLAMTIMALVELVLRHTL